jgi:uncharacterized protein (DUF697 family)
MHDLDRTQSYQETEFDPEMYQFQNEGQYYEGEEGEDEYSQYEFEPEVLDEVEEMELAAQLLEITDEHELDQFLGSVFKKVGKVIKSGVGSKLGGILKTVGKTVLPMAGGALGSFIAPGIGTAIGSKLGAAAGGIFGLEMEGLSPQDQEYEVARRFVRLASSAAQKAQQLQSVLPPDSAARKAVMDAAKKHAPGLLQLLGRIQSGVGGLQSVLGGFQFETGGAPQSAMSPQQNGGGGAGRSGRWIRRGRKIILIGV